MNLLLQADQVPPVVASGSDAMSKLAASGPIGAVCVLLVLAVVYLWIDARTERKEAAKEIKELTARVATADSAKALAIIEVNDRHNRLLAETTTRANAELAAAKEAHLRATNELHAARVADVNLSNQQMVQIVQSCTSALTANSSSLETSAQALAELREGIRDLSEETRAARVRWIAAHKGDHSDEHGS